VADSKVFTDIGHFVLKLLALMVTVTVESPFHANELEQ
jgi:hypothetical protein